MGYDLSQARLQAIAASLGIKQNVAEMNQAQKAQLRYYAVMTQVTTAQGDMARTLNAPANQLRILSASATQAAQALGSIFIPILNVVLPIAIAAAKAVRAVAVAIASLFGYTLPSVDFSVTADGIGGIGGSMDDMADSSDNAGKAAKKLKSVLMGFDEINQLQDPTAGSSGGAGGDSAGSMSGFDFELPQYDFLADMVSSQVDKISRKLQPFIDRITTNLDSILTVVGAIAGGLLSWKIASGLVPSLKDGWNLLSKIGGLTATLAAVGIMVTLVYEFDKNFIKTGNVASLVSDGISTMVGAIIADKVLASSFGAAKGVGGGIALTISAATSLKAMYDGVVEEGWNKRTLGLGIMTAIKGTFAGGLLAKAAGVSILAGGAAGLTVALLATATVALIAIEENKNDPQVDWGDIELTAEQMKATAEGLFNFPVTAQITLAEEAVTGVEEAKRTLETSIAGINTSLNTVRIKTELGSGDYATWQEHVASLVSSLNEYLVKAENAVSVSVAFAPTTSTSGEDLSGSIVTALGIGNEITQTAISREGQKLADLLAKGVEEGLSANEQAMAMSLSQSLQRIATAAATGEAHGTLMANTNLLLSDLTKESFYGVVEEVALLKENLVQSLTEIKTAEYAAIESQLAVYKQGLAEGIYTTEEAIRIQEQIKTLENDLAKMEDLGTTISDGVTTMFEPARQKVITETQELYGALLEGLTFEDVDILGLSFADMSKSLNSAELAAQLETAINEAVRVASGMSVKEFNAVELIGVSGWDLLTSDVQEQLYKAFSSAIGDESKAAEVFASLGIKIGSAITEVANLGTEIETTATEFDDTKATIANAAKEIKTNLGEAKTAAEEYSAAVTTTSSSVETGMGDAETAAAGLSTTITTAGADTKTALAGIDTALSATQGNIQAVGTEAETFKSKIVEIPTEKAVTLTLEGYATAFLKLSNFKKTLDSVSNLTVNLKVKAGLTAGARNFLKQLKVLDTGVTAQINRVLNLSQFAGGGFPRSGELFVANENGRQEMVGRIGNRAAVANQDQIGDAIFKYMDAHGSQNDGMTADALAASIAAALKAAGIGTVSLDGRMLAQSINRESQRIGKPAINY